MKRIFAAIFVCILLATGECFAQNSVTPSPVPVQQFADQNGVPLAGGKLYSYISGTTTPLATYTDSTGTTPNTNPIILDSAGRANIWIVPGSVYRFTLYDAAGNLVWQKDGITSVSLANGGIIGGTFTGSPTFSGNPTFSGSPTFSGNPAFSGNPTFSGSPTVAGNGISSTVALPVIASQVFNLKAYGAKGDGTTDDSAALQAAVNAAHTASPSGGAVLVPPGTYKIVTPPTMYSGIKLISYGDITPPAIWSKFNGAPFNSFTPSPGSRNMSELLFSSAWTIQDMSQIGIEGLVLDFGAAGNLTLKGIGDSVFSFSIQSVPATMPALVIDDDAANSLNTAYNRFENLIVEGGNEGIKIGNSTWPQTQGTTDNTFGKVLILADAQPTGTYVGLDLVGDCDSNKFGEVEIWSTTAMTAENGLVINSASATADHDADGLYIGWYDNTGPFTGTSLVVGPSSNNFIRTGSLAGSTKFSEVAWSGNTVFVWDRLGDALNSGSNQSFTVPGLNVDQGSGGSPSLYFNKAGVAKWQIYDDAGDNLVVNIGGASNVFRFTGSGQFQINENSSFKPVALSGADGVSAGTVTLAAGAGSHTFTTGYLAAPVCTASDQTAANPVKVTSSTTAVTLAGTTTDVVTWICSPAAN